MEHTEYFKILKGGGLNIPKSLEGQIEYFKIFREDGLKFPKIQ